MQIEKYQYDKWTTVSMHHSLKGSLTILGARCNYSPQSLAIYNELLLLSNTSIIIRVFKQRGGINVKNILLKSLHHYNKLPKDKMIHDNEINSDVIYQKDQNLKTINWFSLLLITVLVIVIVVFIYDFNAIKMKINQVNISKSNELQSEYLNNNCPSKGSLPALKEFCQKILRDINSLENQSPTIASIFFMWILDIVNNGYLFIGINNVIVTILIILLIKKLR